MMRKMEGDGGGEDGGGGRWGLISSLPFLPSASRREVTQHKQQRTNVITLRTKGGGGEAAPQVNALGINARVAFGSEQVDGLLVLRREDFSSHF